MLKFSGFVFMDTVYKQTNSMQCTLDKCCTITIKCSLITCDFFRVEMASHLDSATETDGAEPEPEQYQIAAEVVDVELDRQQEQLTKRVDDEVVLTASEYDEIVKRQQVTERLYDQLHEERRQRLDISEKYRRCSEALARENGLVMRYRQLLIKNRLQLKPKDEICVGDELPETFFQGEEFELSGRCPAAGSSTESVQTTEEVTPWEVDMTSSREHQSVLESDEAVVIAQPVFTDAGLPSWNDHRKYSAKPANVSATESAVPQSRGLPTRQLVDEANDAMKTVPTTTSSTTSHDLLQKVLEQNARLKNILRKIVDTQSMTIRDLLVSCSVGCLTFVQGTQKVQQRLIADTFKTPKLACISVK